MSSPTEMLHQDAVLFRNTSVLELETSLISIMQHAENILPLRNSVLSLFRCKYLHTEVALQCSVRCCDLTVLLKSYVSQIKVSSFFNPSSKHCRWFECYQVGPQEASDVSCEALVKVQVTGEPPVWWLGLWSTHSGAGVWRHGRGNQAPSVYLNKDTNKVDWVLALTVMGVNIV